MTLVPSFESAGDRTGADSSESLLLQVDALLRSLENLQLSVTDDTAGGDAEVASGKNLNAKDVQLKVAQLQQPFQGLFQALEGLDEQLEKPSGMVPSTMQRLRSYQTEAHRRLRLLGVEAMKLRAAKQPDTVEKVRSQLSDHLAQLTQFTQAIADEIRPG
ncbi:MAG: heterocyst frequency control protein PatD [Cyanobacteria bacterium J06634_5]